MDLYVLLACVILGVVFVNGWTDAPNSIATAVTTRSMRANHAIGMAAICNFLGVWGMTFFNTSVANTVFSMLDFTSGDTKKSALALFAGMCSVILFSCAAWIFGIPTSESHGLIAGITGAALYLNGASAICWRQWGKILTGLVISLTMGFLLGYFLTIFIRWMGRYFSRRVAACIFPRGEILCAAIMAMVHGAQDGQKFIGVFFIAIMLRKGLIAGQQIHFADQWGVVMVCAVVMALGTMIGGRRIIRSVGFGITPLKQYEGFCADLASACSLLLATLLGFPVSTTHVKTMAVVSVGFSQKGKYIRIRTVKQMVFAWVFTFPACILFGYFLTGIAFRFFS